VVTLEEAKLHCRIDHPEEDTVIEGYIRSSSQWLGKIGINVNVDPIPAPLKQACLLLVSHFYENREAVPAIKMESVLPLGVDALIAPYRDQCV